ncbi:hypothetical protein Lser_V15G45854 [Lactuca serriola]
MRKIFLLGLLISLLVTSFLQPSMGNPALLKAYCKSKCKGKCLKSGFLEKCMKYCEICCEECKCVPTNMFGNKHECPCYKDKKNNKGKPKCP